MIVLVSMRMVDDDRYPECRDAISHDWCRLFDGYGITPVFVPNALADVRRFFDLGAAGIFLTGGDSLGGNAAPTLRDCAEEQLLVEAVARHMPVFGTCRGLQTINRHFGGRVERHLPELHVGEHDVRLSTGKTVRTNSFHNEGVVLDGVARELEIFAFTAGGVVEGVRHRELPLTAIQWHPERPNPSAAIDRELLQEFFARCASSS